MSMGLIGRKCGMTRVFEADGSSVPVTVLQVENNRVTQVKTTERDGYTALQVAAGEKKSSRVSKAMAGHYAAAESLAGRGLWEFRVEPKEVEDYALGAQLPVSLFEKGQLVDACGVSIGKGFQGGVKRHNFNMQDATHGNSISHRSNGSIGQCQTPGRVFKGKKMSGHMGAVKATVQSLTIHSVDEERNLILVKGAVPGPKGGDVVITPAIKLKNKG